MARKRREDKGVIRIDTLDIVGRRFGKLRVIDHARDWYDGTAGGDRMRHSYLCRCDCDTLVVVRRQCLLNGMTKSCGCLKTGRPAK